MRNPVDVAFDRVAYRILRWEDRRLERDLGVETATAVDLDDLAIDPDARDAGFAYVASPRRLIRAIIDALPVEPAEVVFIDMGSGKGRVLLCAAEHAFQRVIGVEFSGELHEIADANIGRLRERRPDAPPMESVNADATTYPLPDADLVVYFNNPFSGPVMRPVLAGLEAAVRGGRRVWAVYQEARHEDDQTDNLALLRASPWFVERSLRWRQVADRLLLRPYRVAFFEGRAAVDQPPRVDSGPGDSPP